MKTERKKNRWGGRRGKKDRKKRKIKKEKGGEHR
jgi:hypothetical protein